MDVFLILASPWFWLLASIGVICTGISKSGFAGGAGVVAVPLLALILPIGVVVIIILPVLIVMDIRTVHYYWRDIDWHRLRILLPMALVGVALGGMLLGQLPEMVLQLLLGMLCLLFALWQPLLPWLAKLPGAAWFWSLISGTTSTLIHAGGPPITMYFISAAVTKLTWIATAGAFFACLNLSKIIPYLLAGNWQPDLLWLSLALLPLAMLGVWLGYRIQKRLSESQFLWICRFLLLGSGLLLISKSITS